jgi:hypothetical protein
VAKLINLSFLEVVKVGDATSSSFKNCGTMRADFSSLKDIFGFNEREQASLACILFTNCWLNRGAPDLLEIPGGMRQWVMEEGRKVIGELGLMVRNAVEDYRGQLPPAVRDLVKDY